MASSPQIRDHQEWLGYLQPVGLVVSPPALVNAQAVINLNIISEHRDFVQFMEAHNPSIDEEDTPVIPGITPFLQEICGWQPEDLTPGDALTDLECHLPQYGETLRPSFAVPEPEPQEGEPPWQMLIQEITPRCNFDKPLPAEDKQWQASPHARFERILRENNIPIGLLSNGSHLRLIYAPQGESSGHITFPLDAMCLIDGRPIFAAFHMLFNDMRLFGLPTDQRLPAILAESRQYQNEVSTKLSEQVLQSLYTLLHGFQDADNETRGTLLAATLREDPDHIYGGLLHVLLRLVFILYAEDRGLMPDHPVYVNHYSLSGLFDRLRNDQGRYPDTMNQRYGAWAHLLALFRILHDGASHGKDFRLPPRPGYLFNPDRYPFLEGRPQHSLRQSTERLTPPLVSDGTVYEVLEKLLILDGERLSYRTLDVEQIGSVYETVMGFTLQQTLGHAIVLKPAKAKGAPVTVDLDRLLAETPGKRNNLLRELSDQRLTGKDLKALREATTIDEIQTALARRIAPTMERRLDPGAMILQPTDERRRSGSHYTPRSLTEPVVRDTLRPILEALGDNPTPGQILSLKVCDPAMGSGAFLVEAGRQLAEALREAWHRHNDLPAIPPDEDELLHARLLVTQRCLYGVDRNPLAVDLAKLSLWLATLARDHGFAFLDHALKFGDSLLGLSNTQICAFHWKKQEQMTDVEPLLIDQLGVALSNRAAIHHADHDAKEEQLSLLLQNAAEALAPLRRVGDLIIQAFFSHSRPAKREELLSNLRARWTHEGEQLLPDLPEGLMPFHWQLEFPEVFQRPQPGFDAFIGNPPFAGKNTLINSNPPSYLPWLRMLHAKSHGNSDLVAHFFRRCFDLLRPGGTLGLIATNTIAQGHTRHTGLRWICTNGGTIYKAIKRYAWPGEAAVVVSIVHLMKGEKEAPFLLDEKEVPLITAFLSHAGGHEAPVRLRANAGMSFQGSIVLGMGFTFDDQDKKGIATPIAEMHRLIKENPRNQEVIFPYIGGAEVNRSPTHAHHRYVINFGDRSEEECRRKWPELMGIVEEKVKPARAHLTTNPIGRKRAKLWWHYGSLSKDLYTTISNMERVLVISCQASTYMVFAFLPTQMVYANSIAVIALNTYPALTVLQSRIHEVWTLTFSSSLEDRIRYTPTDCFETFPFPRGYESNETLEEAGKAYYEYRAAVMIKNNEGLTATYNRFHDPEERDPEILRLRELHAAMDRAVLDAYGWTDFEPQCDFLLDYEEEEEEGTTRRRKKPWRYRWCDEDRDEILARLQALNKAYAEAEQTPG
ncbi:MAG: N-6 DNA methylase [Candidatus Hydrogenedens sp.]|jgi:hypothetical protein|nr:N-6 DNA methylase [Candidatus Hydrogenedens sp.]